MTRQDDPECCKWRGLFYADGRKRCYKHSTPEDRALVAELDERAKPILGTAELGPRWPYGPNIDVESRRLMLNWAEQYGLKLANTRCQELHWLRRGRCSVSVCMGRMGHWVDHVTRWTRKGRPALIAAHPYGLGGEDMRALGQLAQDEEFEVRMSATGWYRHGTVAVEVWRPDVLKEYYADEAGRRSDEASR